MTRELRAARLALCYVVLMTAPAAAQENRTLYVYDGLGRLVTETRPQEGGETVFTYDALGNRLTAVETTLAAPDFDVNDVSIGEGGVLTFTVNKSGAAIASHSLDFSTSNGTAGLSDYQAASGTLTFAPSEFTKIINVQTTQDSTYENPETILLNLSNPTNGATITGAQGVGTINNDDSGPSFVINNIAREEGLNFVFTVTKSGPTEATHNISYATANNSAVAPSDYIAKSGTLSFAPWQTSRNITIASVEDSVGEAKETFRINLSNATNGAIIADSQATGSIINDDNFAPTARNNTYHNVQWNRWRTFYVLNNDSDPEGHDLRITRTTAFTGQAQIINNGKAIRYRCMNCGVLDTQFYYHISDGHGGSDGATVYVNFVGSGTGPGGIEP